MRLHFVLWFWFFGIKKEVGVVVVVVVLVVVVERLNERTNVYADR